MSTADPSSTNVAAPARGAESLSTGAAPVGGTLAVGAAVANLRQEPSHASELVSQLVLGEPVSVLEEANGWLRVAGEDGYPGWVDAGALRLADVAPRPATLIWRRRSGVLRESPEPGAAPLCDLVLGARAAVSGDAPPPVHGLRQVLLPGGYRGWAEAEGWIARADLARSFPRSPQALLQTALALRGVPYLWGGTSSKAFDCSGFSQRVFGLHGVALPRDAWQQAQAGAAIPPDERGKGLGPADLVFFAEGGRRVTHVAIALGEGGRLVHCSTNRAGVAVAGLDPSDLLYAASLTATLVAVRRFF